MLRSLWYHHYEQKRDISNFERKIHRSHDKIVFCHCGSVVFCVASMVWGCRFNSRRGDPPIIYSNRRLRTNSIVIKILFHLPAVSRSTPRSGEGRRLNAAWQSVAGDVVLHSNRMRDGIGVERPEASAEQVS